MLIVCPSCSATYDVPDSLRGSGRPVRCARCAHEWLPHDAETEPEAEEGLPDPGPPTLSEPEPLHGPRLPQAEFSEDPQSGLVSGRISDDISNSPRSSVTKGGRFSAGAVLEWTASFVVLGLLGAASYLWRDRVMEAWPPSMRLYLLLGLG